MFWLILIILVIWVVYYYKKNAPAKKETPEEKGARGENEVIRVLGGTIPGQQYMINNLVLRTSATSTVQIDHIFINKEGIWVIETKSYAGTISGHATQDKWTQTLAGGNVKNQFFNPIKQNNIHIRALRRHLGDKAPLKNIVVFTEANIDYVNADCVYSIDDVEHKIWTPTRLNMSLKRMEWYYEGSNQIRE